MVLGLTWISSRWVSSTSSGTVLLPLPPNLLRPDVLASPAAALAALPRLFVDLKCSNRKSARGSGTFSTLKTIICTKFSSPSFFFFFLTSRQLFVATTIDVMRLSLDKYFSLWWFALLWFGRGMLYGGMCGGGLCMTTRSGLSSSPLQGSQEIFVRSEIDHKMQVFRLCRRSERKNSCGHLKGLTPPFRSFFADSVVVVGSSRSWLSSNASSPSWISSGACSVGFAVVDWAWIANYYKV